MREFVDACRAEGLRAGLYLSPWDRNHPPYGDSPRYNDVYAAQLTELLTRYGPLHEVWFDGANGEGPNGKRQVYDWPRVFGLVRRLQPDAVMFSDAGPDVRWCGNENGIGRRSELVDDGSGAVPYPGADGPGIIDALQHGDPNGTVWRPAEADVVDPAGLVLSSGRGRPGPQSVDNLLELYSQSVGRNSKLLLNVPPTRDGLLHATDVARLSGFHDKLRAVFAENLAASGRIEPLSGARSGSVELSVARPVTVGVSRLAEDISNGQTVSRYTLSALTDAGWSVLSRGTTIGYAKIDRFPAITTRRVRLTIDDAIEPVGAVRISLFAPTP